MKYTLLRIVVALGLLSSAAVAQTYKPDYATKLVLAGSGTSTTNTVTLTTGTPGTSIVYTLPSSGITNGYLLKTDGSGNLSWQDPATGITLGGDVTGAAGTNTVSKLQGKTLTITGLADANLLVYNSTGAGSWNNVAMSGNAAITNAGVVSVNSVQLGAGTSIVSAINDAGTSGTINDNRVTDALTIDGGTVNNTVIGGSGPAAGTFTGVTSGNLTVNAAGTVNFSGNVVNGVGTPLIGTDAANKNYVDNTISNFTLGGDVTGTPGSNTINPANAGIGDRLISGVNAGSTTVNAVRIGNGLTNTQVNNDLTIDGGTVDNTPIGSTGASSGKFTTIEGTTLPAASTSSSLVVSNAGALETRTVASLGLLTSTLTDDNIWIGNGTNVPTEHTLSGNVSMTNTGNVSVNSVQLGAGTSIVSAINDAGTSGTINDNRVNDALTINGGTIDNSPIGNTTPSTVKTTGLTMSGATSPITLNASVGSAGQVLTSGGAGTTPSWSNPGATIIMGSTDVTAFTGTDVEAMTTSATNSFYRISASVPTNLDGVASGTAGRVIVLANVGSVAITIRHNSAASTPNGFQLPNGDSIILGADGTVTLIYDAAAQSGDGRWRVIANY